MVHTCRCIGSSHAWPHYKVGQSQNEAITPNIGRCSSSVFEGLDCVAYVFDYFFEQMLSNSQFKSIRQYGM